MEPNEYDEILNESDDTGLNESQLPNNNLQTSIGRQNLCCTELYYILDTYVRSAKRFTTAVQNGCNWIEDLTEQSTTIVQRNYAWTKLCGFIEGIYLALGIETADKILKNEDIWELLEQVPELHDLIEHIRNQADCLLMNAGYADWFHGKIKPLFSKTDETNNS